MTNVRGHDPVFVPLSKAEYDSLSTGGRFLQRFYRTTLGMGLYYFVEIWFKLEMFPRDEYRPVGKRARTFEMDRLLVILFILTQTALLLWKTWGHGARTLEAIIIGVILPFIAFNMAMGFVIFLHHTHPKVPWYKNSTDFSFFASQVRSSVHAEFPRPLEVVLHNIMDHTAHHADPRIPLYNLHSSQQNLERVYPNEITVQPWTFKGWITTLMTCRLFDYERHMWIDYDGTPLSPELFPTSTTDTDTQK